MKTNRIGTLLFLMAMGVAATHGATAGERGSGSTTGGGDNLISVYALLPKTLEIKVRYDYPKRRYSPLGELLWENVYLGERGGLPGKLKEVWANELDLEIRFDRDAFIQSPEAVPIYLKAVEGERGTWLFSTQFLLPNSVLITPAIGKAEIDRLRLHTVVVRGEGPVTADEFARRRLRLETLNPFEISIVWDSKELTNKELMVQLRSIEETLFSQLSMDNEDSIRNVALFDRFRRILTLSGVEKRFLQALTDRIHIERDEILALAASSKKGSACDAVQYRQLMSKFKGWETGNPEHLQRLRGYFGFLLSGEADNQATKLRQGVLQAVMDAMLVCDDAKRDALNLILNQQ